MGVRKIASVCCIRMLLEKISVPLPSILHMARYTLLRARGLSTAGEDGGSSKIKNAVSYRISSLCICILHINSRRRRYTRRAVTASRLLPSCDSPRPPQNRHEAQFEISVFLTFFFRFEKFPPRTTKNRCVDSARLDMLVHRARNANLPLSKCSRLFLGIGSTLTRTIPSLHELTELRKYTSFLKRHFHVIAFRCSYSLLRPLSFIFIFFRTGCGLEQNKNGPSHSFSSLSTRRSLSLSHRN